MNRILAFRKLFGSVKDTDLATLKTTYRNLIKEYHPDKIQEDDERKAEYEIKSKRIIEAYHFLVSIAPETLKANAGDYEALIATSPIMDFEYKGTTLKIVFKDEIAYEYFGVPKSVYVKMVNSPTIVRFAKRHVYNSFIYRSCAKQVATS
jgi:KTSC domain/DnaJ domain